MARTQDVAVLDIGSHVLRLLIVSKFYTDSYSVKVNSQFAYDGYANGKFYDDAKTAEAIRTVVAKARDEYGKIKKIYVGVPAEFSVNRINGGTIDRIKHRKVESSDMEAVIAMANPFSGDEKQVISRGPIYYKTDNEERMVNAAGTPTVKLEGLISYVASDKSFISFMQQTLFACGIAEVEFLSSVVCEMYSLFDTSSRDNGVLLLDCGYRSTSVSVMSGDGLMYLCSFSRGQGHIVRWLAEGLDVPFPVAARLFKKVDLSYIPAPELTYSVESDKGLLRFSCAEVIKTLDASIGAFCSIVQKALASCSDYRASKLSICLTGDGLNLRGVDACMEHKLGRSVKTVFPTQEPNFKNPCYSRAIGLAVEAFSLQKKAKLLW